MSPKHLYRFWFEVEGRLKKESKIFLMLDYDGTIVPIAEKPELAILNPKVRLLLKNIVLRSGKFKVAIVSGRSIKDLKSFLGLKGIYYVGVHGLTVEGPNLKFTHREAVRVKPFIVKAYRDLAESLKGVSGVFVEDKGFTVAVHYRLAKENRRIIRERVLSVKAKYGCFRLLEGKKVFELTPNIDWGKGDASLLLLKRFRFKHFPIYVGDDKTDEDAFKKLKDKGLTVVVGRKRFSEAKYYVKNVREVWFLLQKLLSLP